MTFKHSACIYPLRLTGLTAGPVEELIYLEGPTHFQPATLAGNAWDMRVYGGPSRAARNRSGLSDLEQALEVAAGRTEDASKRHLTKLRRVFKPEEMTEDILFEEMDYGGLLATATPAGTGQAATQYGRHRDPEGVPALLAALSPTALKAAGTARNEHLLSCVWALGEIGIDNPGYAGLEKALLRCARHSNRIMRMEAYVALAKIGSKDAGPILLDRFEQMSRKEFAPPDPGIGLGRRRT
jgi:hypothetical protein